MDVIKQPSSSVIFVVLLNAAIATAYFVSARIGLILALEQANTSPVWLPTGIALAAILILGFRVSPGIFVGALLANFLNPTPLLASIIIATGNTLEAVVGCYLFLRISGSSDPLRHVKDFLIFITVALIFSTMISATIGVSALIASGVITPDRFGTLWLTWWLGDAAGGVLLAPLILAWTRPKAADWFGSVVEAILLVGIAIVLSTLVFGSHAPGGVLGYFLGYLLAPVLAWSVFNFGYRGITALAAVISLIAITGTADGFGPFVQGTVTESILLLQSFVATIIVTGLVTAILLAERREALLAQKKAQSSLEERVRERTEALELSNAALSESEAHWRVITQNTPDHIMSLDKEGRILFINYTVSDLSPDRVIGTLVYDHLDQQNGEILRRSIDKVFRTGEPGLAEVSYESDAGVMRFENRIAAVKKGGEITSLIVSSRDMTERKRAENIIGTLAEQSFTSLQDDTFFSECVTNLAKFYRTQFAFIGLLQDPQRDRVKTYAVWAGNKLADNFEYDLDGTPCEDVLDLRKQLIPDSAAKLYPRDLLLKEMGVESYFGAPLVTQRGEMIGLVSVMDINKMDPPEWTKPILDIFAHRIAIEMERKRAQEKLHGMADMMSYQATHDPLTDLINRREFESRLTKSLERATYDDAHHVLCYLDLDQFKVVNDTCGHTAGDELLKQVAIKIEAVIRESDTIARLGGDEFGVLLQDCPFDVALGISDKILNSVREFRFSWEDKTFEIGVSIGIVPIDSHSGSLAEIMSAADSACYVAKEHGRNRVHVYKEDDADLARRHGEMQWVTEIPAALEENRLALYQQAIATFDEKTGQHGFLEILVRLNDREGNLLLPESFINAAERYNLMPTIDRWVIENVFSYIAGRPSGPIKYSINLSGTTLSDEHFSTFVRNQLEKSKIDPAAICFEITETAAIMNFTRASGFVRDLKESGFGFALDDFGTGLSSYAYLRDLPVDYLKIDGNFVKDCLVDATNMAIVESINQIGHSMGIETIAEWVETEAVYKELKRIGVDYVQGYWIDRPGPLV